MKLELLKMNLKSLKSRANNEKNRQIKGKITKSSITFSENKPNSPIVQTEVTFLTAMIYPIFASLTKVKNKPNQTQFKANSNPIFGMTKFDLSSFMTGKYEKSEDLAGKKQSQTNPIQTQTNLSSNVAVGDPTQACPLISQSKTQFRKLINVPVMSGQELPFFPGFVNLIKSAAVTLCISRKKEIYVMKLQLIVLAVLSGFLIFTYEPPRPPVLNPDTVPFHYDPNLCQSEPLGYAVIVAGTTYKNNFKVTEPEGSPVTIAITTGQNIVIEPKPYVNLFDPNDSQGKCKIYRYRWSWATTDSDIGLHYVNVRVTDTGGAYDERTFLILVKENQPPIGIMGCHRR